MLVLFVVFLALLLLALSSRANLVLWLVGLVAIAVFGADGRGTAAEMAAVWCHVP